MSADQSLVDVGNGYVMTMADAIVHAHKMVAEAERRRGVLLDQARRNGVPLRTLADMLGVSASTVQRWAGGAVGKEGPAFLDAPVVDTRRRGAA
jgi:DNA-binding transcriptional regulator YiaG